MIVTLAVFDPGQQVMRPVIAGVELQSQSVSYLGEIDLRAVAGFGTQMVGEAVQEMQLAVAGVEFERTAEMPVGFMRRAVGQGLQPRLDELVVDTFAFGLVDEFLEAVEIGALARRGLTADHHHRPGQQRSEQTPRASNRAQSIGTVVISRRRHHCFPVLFIAPLVVRRLNTRAVLICKTRNNTNSLRSVEHGFATGWTIGRD